MSVRQFDVDRVMALWPRLRDRLTRHIRNPLQAYDVITSVEKAIGRGLKVSAALKSDTRVSVLGRHAQCEIVAAAREDLQRQSTDDLFGVALARSLDELLQDIRSSDPTLATSAFEAREELRPTFKRVGHIFVSRHTESTNAAVADVVNRLEFRGLDCWYASRNVISDWHSETLEAAETCSEGLLLLTREALSAPYVLAEAKIIIGAGRRVLTLAMEPGIRPRDINMALENWQHHKWYEGPDAAVEAVISAIEPVRA